MIYSVEWETDGETVDLPTEVDVPAEVHAEGIDAALDWLSDKYGWLVAAAGPLQPEGKTV